MPVTHAAVLDALAPLAGLTPSGALERLREFQRAALLPFGKRGGGKTRLAGLDPIEVVALGMGLFLPGPRPVDRTWTLLRLPPADPDLPSYKTFGDTVVKILSFGESTPEIWLGTDFAKLGRTVYGQTSPSSFVKHVTIIESPIVASLARLVQAAKSSPKK